MTNRKLSSETHEKHSTNSKFTIKNGDVTLPITRSGKGQPVVFFNGGGATQISWKKIIQQLRVKGAYEIITFDFRAHGKASIANNYSFEAFLSDAEAAMNAVAVPKPIIVGWSLGADLAVAYAAKRPNEVGGLVIVDGAVPLTEPLVDDPVSMRHSLNSLVVKIPMLLTRLTPYGYRLSGDAFADITLELDKRRQANLLDAYGTINCPITIVLATKSAGTKGAHAQRNNKLWHKGAERLAAAYPSISVQWLDGTHALPFRHPVEIAEIVDALAKHVS